MRLSSLLRVPVEIAEGLLSQIPGGTGIVLRRIMWRPRLHGMGKNVRIETGVKIANPASILLGDNVCIDHCVTLLAGTSGTLRSGENRNLAVDDLPAPGSIAIGNNTHVAQGALVSGRGGGVCIGADTTVAAGSKIYSSVNHYRSKREPTNRKVSFTHLVPAGRQFMIEGPVVIEENCGLAVNSVVLPGTHIRRDSFVTMFSVVRSGDYPGNSILDGNPAQRIGDRFLSSKQGK